MRGSNLKDHTNSVISPADVVERVISQISGSGGNVTVDNWFTSVPLEMNPLKNHNLTHLGTIRKNKKEIPPELVQTKNKAVNTSIFCFRKEMTMVSYVPEKGKVRWFQQCKMMIKLMKQHNIQESRGSSPHTT
jgi:hypothetical protein